MSNLLKTILLLTLISYTSCQIETKYIQKCIIEIVDKCKNTLLSIDCVEDQLIYHCYTNDQCSFVNSTCDDESCTCELKCSSDEDCRNLDSYNHFCGRKGYCVDKVELTFQLYNEIKK